MNVRFFLYLSFVTKKQRTVGDFCQGKKIYQITSHHVRHLTNKKWYFSTPPKCAAPVNWITADPGPSSPRCASKAASALRIFSHGNTNAAANVGPTHLTYNHNLLSHPPLPKKQKKNGWQISASMFKMRMNKGLCWRLISGTISAEHVSIQLGHPPRHRFSWVISLPLWHPKKGCGNLLANESSISRCVAVAGLCAFVVAKGLPQKSHAKSTWVTYYNTCNCRTKGSQTMSKLPIHQKLNILNTWRPSCMVSWQGVRPRVSGSQMTCYSNVTGCSSHLSPWFHLTHREKRIVGCRCFTEEVQSTNLDTVRGSCVAPEIEIGPEKIGG